METMEDSGFDSDNKPLNTGIAQLDIEKMSSNHGTAPVGNQSLSSLRKTVDLQKKLERQREAARNKGHSSTDVRKAAILSRNRLLVPKRSDQQLLIDSPDMQPLVMIDSDDSDDEFTVPTLSKEAHREITQQLIKDGYNLDLEPDDEDLDLIPPRPLNERLICCNHQVNCAIQ